MRRLALLAFAAVAASAAPGCFNPDQPPCAFTCAAQSCPAGYTCGPDLICHNPDNPGECDISPPDASPPDAAAD
jgi:hypothetical protein